MEDEATRHSRLPSRHVLTPHTAELALWVTAATPADLCAEAGRALGHLFIEEVGSVPDAGPEATRRLELHAVDSEALLVDFLNELIYLAETERWAPVDVHVLDWRSESLAVTMAGARLRDVPSRIKSATHHGLVLRHGSRGWEAEVIFDV